jgi:hypothetical protein
MALSAIARTFLTRLGVVSSDPRPKGGANEKDKPPYSTGGSALCVFLEFRTNLTLSTLSQCPSA